MVLTTNTPYSMSANYNTPLSTKVTLTLSKFLCI